MNTGLPHEPDLARPPPRKSHRFPNIAAETIAVVPERRPGRWREVLAWLAGAFLASILVLTVVALVAPPRSMLVARLATADARLSYEVTQLGTALKVTRVAGMPAAKGLVHELWLREPGQTPVALGLLAGEPVVIDHPVPPAGWTLEISLEGEGGSKSGMPSGPIILTAVVGG